MRSPKHKEDTIVVEIRKENVHRVVEEHEFESIWKPRGFEIVKEQPNNNSNNDEEQLDLDSLKAEANALGITYMPNIGARKLSEKIAEFKRNNQ